MAFGWLALKIAQNKLEPKKSQMSGLMGESPRGVTAVT